MQEPGFFHFIFDRRRRNFRQIRKKTYYDVFGRDGVSVRLLNEYIESRYKTVTVGSNLNTNDFKEMGYGQPLNSKRSDVFRNTTYSTTNEHATLENKYDVLSKKKVILGFIFVVPILYCLALFTYRTIDSQLIQRLQITERDVRQRLKGTDFAPNAKFIYLVLRGLFLLLRGSFRLLALVLIYPLALLSQPIDRLVRVPWRLKRQHPYRFSLIVVVAVLLTASVAMATFFTPAQPFLVPIASAMMGAATHIVSLLGLSGSAVLPVQIVLCAALFFIAFEVLTKLMEQVPVLLDEMNRIVQRKPIDTHQATFESNVYCDLDFAERTTKPAIDSRDNNDPTPSNYAHATDLPQGTTIPVAATKTGSYRFWSLIGHPNPLPAGFEPPKESTLSFD